MSSRLCFTILDENGKRKMVRQKLIQVWKLTDLKVKRVKGKSYYFAIDEPGTYKIEMVEYAQNGFNIIKKIKDENEK